MRVRYLMLALLAASVPSAGWAAQATTIPEIQGSGHTSPLNGKMVTFQGVVTQLRDGTFFVQDPVGDGNDLTSDGILIRRAPGDLARGDLVRIEGIVEEQGRFGEFTTTTITDLVFRRIGVGVVPTPIIIGGGGRVPPTETVVSTAKGFDPRRSGADFFETIEGMFVEIKSPIVVGPMKKANSFVVVADEGKNATGMNSLDGITATPGDFNPERIRVQVAKPFLAGNFQVSLGDRYGALRGSVITDQGAYGIQLAEAAQYTPRSWSWSSIASPPAADILTIASYNVENLDAKVEDAGLVPSKDDIDDDLGNGKFSSIAKHVVGLLGSPDIVALQEVQDNDGGEYSDVVTANRTLDALIGAIADAGGPRYKSVSLDPVDDVEGGQPGGTSVWRSSTIPNVSQLTRRMHSELQMLRSNAPVYPSPSLSYLPARRSWSSTSTSRRRAVATQPTA